MVSALFFVSHSSFFDAFKKSINYYCVERKFIYLMDDRENCNLEIYELFARIYYFANK